MTVRSRNASTGSCLPLTSTLPSGSTTAAAPSNARVRFADHDLTGWREPFESRCQVHRVANRGERTDVFATDVADERGAGVDPDPDLRPVGMLGRHRVDRPAHREAGARGRARVVRLTDRCVEQHHQRVTDEVRDGAAPRQEDRHRETEVVVQHLHDLGRFASLRERGEALEVGEQHRDLALLAAERRLPRIREQRGGDVRRHVLPEEPVEVVVHARVLDRDRELPGERREQRLVVLGSVAFAASPAPSRPDGL